MRVLFLAVGGTRRRAVIEESAQAVADGQRVTVLIDRAGQWAREQFPAGVAVVELGALDRRSPIPRIEQALLFKAPRTVLRVVGRGRLRNAARRAERSYEARFAKRAHRVFLRAWAAPQARARLRVVEQLIERGSDLLVVADPVAMRYAARAVTAGSPVSSARVCFSYDHVDHAAPDQQLRPVPNAAQGDDS